MARTALTSPKTVEELKSIDERLQKKDEIFSVIGMIGALNLEHRANFAQIASLLKELRNNSPDVSLIKAMLVKLGQTRMVEDSVRDICQRRDVCAFEQMAGYTHLSTGVCLYKGEFGVQNYEVAARELHAAADAGWSDAYYYLGMLYKFGQGVETCTLTAKNFFQKGTNARIPAAITELGNCLIMGFGVEVSVLNGVKYLKQGAEARDPEGMGGYSWMKLYGYNTDVNLQLGYQMARDAEMQGCAKDVLALCYEQGIGVDRNPEKAVDLYLEGLQDKRAWIGCLPLARCYEEGIGVEQSLRKAAEFYKHGTELIADHRPYFQAYYGMCLIRGRGVPEDKEKGWAEVYKSIQAKNATGWFAKGECHRFGYGAKTDLVKAAKCYQRSIETYSGMDGKIKASFALGIMYDLGEGGLPQDFALAFKHFNFAANRMHQEAQWKVAIACETGTGVNRFEDRAVYYFRLAANGGHRKAQLKASEYYMKGKGVSRDLHTAVQILLPAAENGDRAAKRLLRRAQIRLVLRRQLPIRTRSIPPRFCGFSRGWL